MDMVAVEMEDPHLMLCVQMCAHLMKVSVATHR